MHQYSPISRRVRALLCAAVVSGAAGVACVDPLGPPPLDGTYVLVAIDGAPLPHVTVWPHFTHSIVAETLSFPADGWGERRLWYGLRYPSDTGLRPAVFRIPVRRVIRDRRWVLEEEHHDLVGLPPPRPTFALTTHGEDILLDRFEGRHTYRRVAP